MTFWIRLIKLEGQTVIVHVGNNTHYMAVLKDARENYIELDNNGEEIIIPYHAIVSIKHAEGM